MSADWVAIENAFRVWVRDASGLADDRVIWAHQNGARPDAPFATLAKGPLVSLGAATELNHEYDSLAPAGEEIEFEAKEQKQLSLSVQFFGGLPTENASSFARASKVQTALGLLSVKTALETVGVFCFDRGRVESVPEVLDADWEPRALLVCRFYVTESATEKTTYIQKTEITDLETGDMWIVDSGV